MLKYAEAFNHKLLALAADLMRRMPADADVALVQRRLSLGLGIDVFLAIKLVGPYLYRYRDQIFKLESAGAEAEQFFLENDYSAELSASVDPERADLVSKLIPKAKECARALPVDERLEYKTLIINLLDIYLDYLEVVTRSKK